MHCYRKMLTDEAAARDQSVIKDGVMIALDCQRIVQLLILKFAICFHIASSNVFVVLYNKSHNNDWPLRKH